MIWRNITQKLCSIGYLVVWVLGGGAWGVDLVALKSLFLLKALRFYIVVLVVQSLIRFQLFATLWAAARQAFLSISWSLLRLMCIESVMPSNHLILCRPLLLPSIFPSFSSVLSHVQLFATPWTAAYQTSPSITDSQSCSNSCPLNWWCHPGISSSAVPFSSCLQSFPTSGSLLTRWLFESSGQVLEFQLQQHSFQWIFRTDFF